MLRMHRALRSLVQARHFSKGKLDGQVALITGGARGIGRAIARCMSAEGAETIIADIDKELGEVTAENIKNSSFIECDVGSAESIKACFGEVERRVGRLHILVNNASEFIFGH